MGSKKLGRQSAVELALAGKRQDQRDKKVPGASPRSRSRKGRSVPSSRAGVALRGKQLAPSDLPCRASVAWCPLVAPGPEMTGVPQRIAR